MAKKPPYRALLLLFFLSGAAGLVYEVAWARILALTFGNTVLAISTVVGAFLGGLGLGGLLGGRLSNRIRDGVRAYALLEIAVGALSFFTPPLFYRAGGVHRALTGLVGFETPLFVLLRFLLVFLMLLVPTTLMGASLPILCRRLIRSRTGIGTRVGHLYAVNTLGAAAGAFACGFVLIEARGNAGTVHLAAALNVLVGAIAWRWRGASAPEWGEAAPHQGGRLPERTPKARPAARKRGGRKRRGARPPATPAPGIPRGWIYGITGISGFVSMGLQIVWIRAFRHFISNSTYAFSLILVVYLLGIGAGSLAAGRWVPRLKRPFLLFGLLEAALGGLALLSLPILSRLFYVGGIHAFLFSGAGLSFAQRALHYGLAVSLVIFLPTLVMGLVFPLAATLYTQAVADVGRFVGDLYFINTIGSIAGSLAAGFLLLPLLGINGSILFASALIATCGLLVILQAAGGRPAPRAAAAVAVPALFVLLYAGVPRGFTYRGVLEDPQRRILYYDEGVMSTVKVFESLAGIRTMSVDGNSIGSAPYTYADMKQRLMAHLPMLVGPRGREILNIGLGTGITAGCFTLYPEVSRIRAVEIVPGVIEGARLFGADNRGLFSNPAVDIRTSDGMTWLQVVDRSYDVIASDGKLNPLYSGNSIVLCREFYALCRARLRPGGRFAQWINASIPTRELLVVLKTISGVFPEVDLFFYPPANVFLLAGEQPLRIDPARVRARMRDTPGIADDLAMYQIDDPDALPGGYVGNARAFAPLLHDLPVNSWNRTVVEFETPRIWFDRPKELHVAETLRLFLRHGSPSRGAAGLARVVKGFDRMDTADRAGILRAAGINRLYMEALVSYLTTQDRARFRGALERILEIDPDNRRAKAWLREPRRFITF